MNLSPIYVRFMAETVGILMVKANFVGLTAPEQAQVLTIALHMATHDHDRDKIMERIKDHGDMMYEFLDGYVNCLRGHIREGLADVQRAQSDLDRILAEARGQSMNKGPN